MCDWTPVTWHLKGTTLTVVSLYLDCNRSLTDGINSRKLTALAAFLKTLQGAWVVCGDFNTDPKTFWATGWPKAMGASAIISLPEDQHTCFLAEQEPSHIDFAMTNDAGSKLITGVEGVYDVPWKPHIGLKFTIRGQGLATQCRTINLPKAFPHPPRKGKAPNPQSKRTKRRLQAKAKEEAEATAA
jgi:hypothetical protein